MDPTLRQLFLETHPAAWRAYPDPSRAPADLTPRLAAADYLDELGRHREAAILRDTRRHAYLDFGGRVEDAGDLVRQLNEGFNPHSLADNFTRRYVESAVDPSELGPHPDTGGNFGPGDVTHQTLAAMIADAHHIRALHEGQPGGERVSHTPAGEVLHLSREYPAVSANNDPWFGGLGWADHPIHKQLHDYARLMGRHPLMRNPIAPGLIMSDLALGGYSVPHPYRVPSLPDPYDPTNPEHVRLTRPPEEPPTMNAAHYPYAAAAAPTAYAPPPAGGVYRYTPLPEPGQPTRPGEGQFGLAPQQQYDAGYPAPGNAPPGGTGPMMAPPYDPLGRPQAGDAPPYGYPAGPATGGQLGGPPGSPPYGGPADPSPDGWGHTDPMGHPYGYDEEPAAYADYHYPPGLSPLEAVMHELADAFQYLDALQTGTAAPDDYCAYGEEDDYDDQYAPEDAARFREQDARTAASRAEAQRRAEEERRALEQRRAHRERSGEAEGRGYADDDFPLPYDFGAGPTYYDTATVPGIEAEIRRVYNTLRAGGGGGPGYPITAHQVRALLPREMQGGALDAMRRMMQRAGYRPPGTFAGTVPAPVPDNLPTSPHTGRPYVPLSGMGRVGDMSLGRVGAFGEPGFNPGANAPPSYNPGIQRKSPPVGETFAPKYPESTRARHPVGFPRGAAVPGTAANPHPMPPAAPGTVGNPHPMPKGPRIVWVSPSDPRGTEGLPSKPVRPAAGTREFAYAPGLLPPTAPPTPAPAAPRGALLPPAGWGRPAHPGRTGVPPGGRAFRTVGAEQERQEGAYSRAGAREAAVRTRPGAAHAYGARIAGAEGTRYRGPGFYGSLPSAGMHMSPEKARKILHDGTVHGHPLTEKQRGLFGAIAGGS